MSSSNKKSGSAWKSTRHDKFYHLAKEQGYRSRAAFKLIQLNKKFNFLSKCKSCLDLCAAPGGWTQVATKYMPVASMVVAIDLVKMKSIRGASVLQGDITSQQCKSLLKKELQGWDCDVVLHDGAPNVGGGQSWSRDAYQQVELVIYALRLVVSFLRVGGTFVTKIFRSQDYNALLWVLNQFFNRVEVTKPTASRLASAEIFAVCLDYKKPKSVDPSLLDPNVIFQHFEDEEKKRVNVFKGSEKPKGIRSREGYSTDKSIVFEQMSAAEFVSKGNDDAIGMLGTYNKLAFDLDDEGKALRELSITTQEIVTLCEDLRVLGKGDFKALMKWREKIRRNRKRAEEEQNKEKRERERESTEKGESEEDEDEEVKLTKELEEYKLKIELNRKKERKKKKEQKMKQSKRVEMNKNNLSDGAELLASTSDEGLFSLSSIPSNEVLDEIEKEGDVEIEDKLSDDENSSAEIDEAIATSDEDEDYVDRLEIDLDRQFEQMRRKRLETRKLGKVKTADNIVEEERNKRKKLKEYDGNDEEEKKEEEEEDDTDFFNTVARPVEPSKDANSGSEEEENDSVYDSEDGIEDGSADDDIEDDRESDNDNGDTASKSKGKPSKHSHPLLTSLGVDEEEVANERFFDSPAFKDFIQNTGFDPIKMSGDSKSNKSTKSLNSESKSYRTRPSDFENIFTAPDDSEEEQDIDDADEDDDVSSSSDSEVEERKRVSQLRSGYLHGLSSMSKTPQQIAEGKRAEDKRAKKRAAKERRENRKRANVSEMGDGDSNDGKPPLFEYDAEGDLIVPDLDSSKKAKKLARRARRESGESMGPTPSSKTPTMSFEEVAPESDTSDSDAQAHVLAIGHKMLNKRKRDELIDDSYNRYSSDFAELENLPDWFVQEESVFNKAEVPVSKEEMASVKSKLRALSERPIKKILEAKSRNAHKTALKWEKIKQKAEAISKDEGTSEGLKMKEISRLFGKKRSAEKKERKYIVSRKGGGTQPTKSSGGGKVQIVRVDGRMKKDKRGKKTAEKRNGRATKTRNKRRKMS